LPFVFQWFCLVFLLTRIVWAALLEQGLQTATFTVNRFSMAIFFTSLTLILFSWIQVLSAEFGVQTGFLPGLKVSFVACNVFLYVVLIISFGLYLANRNDGDEWEGNKFYDANILVIAGINLLAVVIFLLYGLKLYYKLRADAQFSGAAVRLTFVAFVMVGCFVCRLIFFAWRPVTGRYLPEPVFYTMGYLLPEIVPITVQFYLFFRRLQLSVSAKYQALDRESDNSPSQITTISNPSTEMSTKTKAGRTAQPAAIHRADVRFDGDDDDAPDVEESGSAMSFYEMLREGPQSAHK